MDDLLIINKIIKDKEILYGVIELEISLEFMLFILSILSLLFSIVALKYPFVSFISVILSLTLFVPNAILTIDNALRTLLIVTIFINMIFFIITMDGVFKE